MKIKLWVLKKVTQRNGKKVDISILTWNDWRVKLKEEEEELGTALQSKDKAAIMEEVFDVIQVCVGILAKLFKEGMIVEQGVHRHNKKLVNRGCEVAAEIKFNVSRK